MKKKKTVTSRKFRVRAELNNFELAKARSALKLQIYNRGVKTGELEVGRGSLYWWGAYRQKSKRIGWRKFAEMMDQLAYGKSRPSADE